MACCNFVVYELDNSNFDDNGMLILKHPFMLVLFKAEYCGHCQRFYPTWEQLISQYRRKTCVCFGEVEATKTRVTKAKVNGYPTIMLYDRARHMMYEYGRNLKINVSGDRTLDDLTRFLDYYVL